MILHLCLRERRIASEKLRSPTFSRSVNVTCGEHTKSRGSVRLQFSFAYQLK